MRDWVPLAVAACALLAALANYRGTLKVSKNNEEANQIKWFQEARAESAAAKKEADDALEEAAEARRDLARTKREVMELRDTIEELSRWALRVINWKDDPSMGLEEIRRLINGGPPSLRQIGPPGERRKRPGNGT